MATFAAEKKTTHIEQAPASLFAGGRMEGMSTGITQESKFWQILEKNRLVDLSQYHAANFYDEVPLYTRLADISFLSDYSTNEANAVLLRYALKFLKSVISYEEHDTPFFAAITVSAYAPDAPIVPNLFVWSDHGFEIYGKLTLREVRTPTGKKIKRLAAKLDLPDLYAVFEDVATVSEAPRVFIAPLHPPYPGFVPIYMFCRPAELTHAATGNMRKRP